jgi:hypothetical protein
MCCARPRIRATATNGSSRLSWKKRSTSGSKTSSYEESEQHIDRHENVEIGLGIRLCKQKYRVRFYTAADLATELAEAQANHRLTRLEQSLEKIDLLILDELSYLTFTRPQAELLFHQLSVRNERGSVAITTNLEFSRWEEFFPDTMLTAALIDRITHHAHILNMNGDSYRLKQRMRTAKGGEFSNTVDQSL